MAWRAGPGRAGQGRGEQRAGTSGQGEGQGRAGWQNGKKGEGLGGPGTGLGHVAAAPQPPPALLRV